MQADYCYKCMSLFLFCVMVSQATKKMNTWGLKGSKIV